MRIHYPIALSLFLLINNALHAQFQGQVYVPSTAIKVYAYGQEKTMAWGGGFNNPQIQLVDINNDHNPDMVVFEAGMGVRTFINTGTAGSPSYVYAPAYAVNFKNISNYMILKDYNCDGIADLFSQGGVSGFVVYKGYYNASNQLCFMPNNRLTFNNVRGIPYSENAFNNGGDIPAIVDIDNDGDLDFLSYDNNGGNINYYQNMSREKGYGCDTIIIRLADQCWGKVYQGNYRTHTLQYECDNSILLPKGTKVTHSGNTPCLFDYDGDGDYDYLDGNISFNEMTFLLNGRIPYKPTGPDSMTYQDTLWQSNGHIIELPTFPAAFNIDADQDGKADLVITPHLQGSSENYKCVWFYKNESTPGHPSFVFQSDTLYIDKTIDLGTAAIPFLFDYNKDGKPDLFIGSDGYYQSNGTLKSRVSLYLNTSTTGNPSFTLQTTDLGNLSAYNFAGAVPAVGDLNNDGKQDMVLGHTDGTISFLSNTANSDNVQPNWQMTTQVLKDIANNIITVSRFSAPFIYDINKDGKPDLLIGGDNGSLTYYENVSTGPGNVALKYITSTLGDIQVDSPLNVGANSTPFIGKVDNTGRDYLLMGSNSGKIYRYDGFQSGNVTGRYARIDSQYSLINTTLGYGNLRSAIAVADVDADGKYEMVMGMAYGGVQLYKQNLLVSVPNNINANTGELDIQVYPNPAKDNITLAFGSPLAEHAQVSIINMEGQQLATRAVDVGQNTINIPLANLPAGIYVCVVAVNDHKYYNKFTIMK